MAHRATLIGLALLGLLALGMGVWVGDRLFGSQSAPTPDIAGIYLTAQQPFEEFRLINGDGQPFTRADLQGKWTFLYFGYSYCPDVCPLTLVELHRLQQRLVEQGADANTAYVFISVDPQRDTPQRLKEYVQYFNPKFQGATGAFAELSKLAKPLQVFYKRSGDRDSANYTVDHTSTVSLIDPDGLPRAIFTPPQDPERMAQDFIKIRAAAS